MRQNPLLHPLLRLTFPRAKLWRQIFMTRRNSGRRIGRNFGRNFLDIFVLHSLCRATHQNFPQIPPTLSLHVLSWLLGLKSQNFISASFWGLGCPTTLNPFRDIHENPLFTQFKGGGNCFIRKGPEAVPTQHKSREGTDLRWLDPRESFIVVSTSMMFPPHAHELHAKIAGGINSVNGEIVL